MRPPRGAALRGSRSSQVPPLESSTGKTATVSRRRRSTCAAPPRHSSTGVDSPGVGPNYTAAHIMCGCHRNKLKSICKCNVDGNVTTT